MWGKRESEKRRAITDQRRVLETSALDRHTDQKIPHIYEKNLGKYLCRRPALN